MHHESDCKKTDWVWFQISIYAQLQSFSPWMFSLYVNPVGHVKPSTRLAASLSTTLFFVGIFKFLYHFPGLLWVDGSCVVYLQHLVSHLHKWIVQWQSCVPPSGSRSMCWYLDELFTADDVVLFHVEFYKMRCFIFKWFQRISHIWKSKNDLHV